MVIMRIKSDDLSVDGVRAVHNDNSLGRALTRQVKQLGATLNNRATARAIGLAQGGAVSVYTPPHSPPQKFSRLELGLSTERSVMVATCEVFQ